MKKTVTIFLSLAIIFSFGLSSAFAQKDAADDIFIVLPAQSIAEFLSKLVPYEINMGKYFSGSLWVKSIKNFKIEKNKISFSSHLYGEDIIYKAKIGKQVSSIALGNVNMLNDWEGAFRFDADKKTLYIKPHLKEQVGAKKENRNETIINILLKALSDIEYPIDLKEIKPISTELLGNSLTINFDISNIYAADNRLTVWLRPIPQKGDKNKAPADKTASKN